MCLDNTQTALELEEQEVGKLPVPPELNVVLDPPVNSMMPPESCQHESEKNYFIQSFKNRNGRQNRSPGAKTVLQRQGAPQLSARVALAMFRAGV